MAAREYVWTDEGVSMARRHGVDLAEVAQALYAPPSLRWERHIGDLLL
jgi:hypothetical protein